MGLPDHRGNVLFAAREWGCCPATRKVHGGPIITTSDAGGLKDDCVCRGTYLFTLRGRDSSAHGLCGGGGEGGWFNNCELSRDEGGNSSSFAFVV